MGAEKDAVLAATRDLGIKVDNATFYTKGKTKEVFGLSNEKLLRARSADYALYSSGVTMAFSAEEKKDLAEV